jgi:hypothetical protein
VPFIDAESTDSALAEAAAIADENEPQLMRASGEFLRSFSPEPIYVDEVVGNVVIHRE